MSLKVGDIILEPYESNLFTCLEVWDEDYEGDIQYRWEHLFHGWEVTDIFQDSEVLLSDVSLLSILWGIDE